MSGFDPAPPAIPRTVLIVDDDADVRSLVALALHRAQFVPVEVSSGEEALDVLDSVQPSIVVLDMGMPGISGIDVIRTLRQRPESATLPILLMTGSGDHDTVLHALSAGADDFLAKPVRLDELVARLEAHLRTQSAWGHQVEAGLHARADVVGALGRMTLPSEPHEAAGALARELGLGAGFAFVAILHQIPPGRVSVFATFTPALGISLGRQLSPREARDLITRARQGPWVEGVGPGAVTSWIPAEILASLRSVATAPLYAGTGIVGLLVTGHPTAAAAASGYSARLIAEVIDYANIISVAIGPTLARHGRETGLRQRLQRTLTTRAFYPVFQPIMDLVELRPVAFEALTRFEDGTPPDVRFAEAAAAGLGLEFEVATMEAAILASDGLPVGATLCLNASPALAVESRRLSDVLRTVDRSVILELTEHTQIDDYEQLRTSLSALRPRVRISVDDAGAGYASFRHILELRPAYVKLDLTIVRGIDADPLRQGLVAGLVYFATRTGSELIAEGIETEEEATVLRDLSIRYGQGYLLGRPERVA